MILQCSATCGVGIRLRSVLCGRMLGNGTQVYIDQGHCIPEARPDDHVTCNLPKCNGKNTYQTLMKQVS